jgi:N-acetyl sugar amidotransferase
MDTTDPEIVFDAEGVCNHCHEFDKLAAEQWFPGPEGSVRLNAILDDIRREGRGKPYDCILGLSGGADSTYLAMKAKDWGLRPLVMHVDAGWNSDLHTHVVDWEEMRDLHLAYLKAGVANQDVPQDHVFFATLYNFATANGIRTILSGGNIATEGIFAQAWQGSAMDEINLRAIHKKFGSRPIKTYSTIGFWQYYFWYPFIKKMRTVRPLNYMPYVKTEAIAEMERTFGYKPYDRKHGESLFTKIFQNYYQPKKFGYDKRLPHLSSLIVSGQMSRDEALAELKKPLYDPQELETDIAFLCKKLRITPAEFEAIIAAPNRRHTDFPTWDSRRALAKAAQSQLACLTGRQMTVYS